MVRRIKTCSICVCRFISVANGALCSACKEQCGATSPAVGVDAANNDDGNRKDSPFEPHTKRPRVEEQSELVDLSTLKDHGNDDEFSDDDGGHGSEGEDEIHCTQIDIESDEEEDGLQQSAPIETNSEPCSIPPPQAYESESPQTESPVNSSDDICFICGVELTKLKRRLDHIKRCSKKHGITGRDVKVNNDHEEFVAPVTAATSAAFNPYANKENGWHGDSIKALRVASNDLTTNIQPEQANSAASKQTSLSSFFQMPSRSVNNVLLAGARRISKVIEMTAKQEPNDAASKPTQKRRFGRRDYTKVSIRTTQIRFTSSMCESATDATSCCEIRGHAQCTNKYQGLILFAMGFNMPNGMSNECSSQIPYDATNS